MNRTKRNSLFCGGAALLTLLALLFGGPVAAQTKGEGSQQAAQTKDGWEQQLACPGWNNPTSFTYPPPSGSLATKNYKGYKGKLGDKQTQAPNAANATTGITWNTTIIDAGSLSTTTMSTGGDCALFPGSNMNARAFTILDSNTQCSGAGFYRNRDPNTNHQLRYVPTQYNVYDSLASVQTELAYSIRIGDACGRSSSSVPNSEALHYYMHVTPDNALMILYYSCVTESASYHNNQENAAFLIRVQSINDDADWTNESNWHHASPTGTIYSGNTPRDTMAYFITATPASSSFPSGLQEGVNGWHYYNSNYGSGYTPYDIWWKDWDKVVFDLTPYLYSDVRIEVMVCDCSSVQHFSYGYICGECRPMRISSNGCPGGMSTDVTTLSVPRGLRNYVWYRSMQGGAETSNYLLDNSDPNSTAYYQFQQLTPDVGNSDTSYMYKAQSADFNVEYRPNAAHNDHIPASADSMCNVQTFLCEVTSALNPAKPYKSKVYSNVQNIKPTMEVKVEPVCGGDVQLTNESYVPGNQSMVALDSTVWYFYDNPMGVGEPLDSLGEGDTVSVHFDGADQRWVKVITNIDEFDPAIPSASRPEHNACYSEAIYPIQPLPNPVAALAVEPNDRVLCASDPHATLHDISEGSTYREWRFRDPAQPDTDDISVVVVGVGDENKDYTQEFTFAREPFELTVRNGLYHLNPEDQTDTIWCENTAHDTVYVFQNPELSVLGDSIVCMGDTTDITVTTPGIQGCQFQWSTTNGHVTGNFPPGPHLAVEPTADTVVYYVRVMSEQGCEAWGSARAFRVNPRLSMIPADGQICPGDEVTLIGSNAHHFTWTATPADPSLAGQDSLATAVVTPQESTTYTLVGHGSNDCSATPLTTDVTVHPYPVPRVHLDPGIVDSENPTLTLRDDSPYSVSTTWTFVGNEVVTGREVTHTFEEATGVDSVYVTLTSVNDLGCETVHTFGIPVNLYTAWFPNVFTPGSEDENAAFRLYSINVYEFFHIYIYNRFGQLVYESADPAFEWQGTMEDGTPCPQGTYTYICRFRKPGVFTVSSMYGSLTLLR